MLHSCETAINDSIWEWKLAQSDNKYIIAVFLDLKRAFETIDPGILVNKLSIYGIQDIALNWITSYLSNRKQVVKLSEIISAEKDNKLGISQGSILGPLLFNVYINDIGNCLKYCEIRMFADDTLIYIKTNTIDEAVNRLNSDLNNIFHVLSQNKLKLNVDKTKVLSLKIM